MYALDTEALQKAIEENVAIAIAEDISTGDISAGLIPATTIARAEIITRQDMILAGKDWAVEVFRQIDPSVEMKWFYEDGDRVNAGELIVEVHGGARSLLTGERSALNFIQMLSAVATKTRYFVDMVDNSSLEIIDTRKTLPGLRLAQKYAVTCGGGSNHRMGLYDAFLIKENHIAACGGIANAVAVAREQQPGKLVEVETETLEELDQALDAGADIIMLDNFSLEDTRAAVERSRGKARIEASGGINEETLKSISATGVDFISMGTLTKDIKAIDLSMRLYM